MSISMSRKLLRSFLSFFEQCLFELSSCKYETILFFLMCDNRRHGISFDWIENASPEHDFRNLIAKGSTLNNFLRKDVAADDPQNDIVTVKNTHTKYLYQKHYDFDKK